MRYLGSYPGAYLFRLILIVIIMGSLIFLFFRYTDKISIATEKASIQQTKNIINSSLAIVFATYAVKGELDRLNELDGGNPFDHLAEYNLTPANYQGEIRAGNLDDLAPGWYYDKLSGKVIYKSYYGERVYKFSQILDYHDVNKSGRYEPDIDVYQMLNFR